MRIPLLLFLLSISCLASAKADSYVSASLIDMQTVEVTFQSGTKISFGRNKGEGVVAFKARVKATVIEILSILNRVPESVDVTADLQ